MVQPRVAQTLTLARSELTPPSLKGFKADLNKMAMPELGKVSEMTMNEVGGRLLVLGELFLWFNVGVVLGKGTIVGYGFRPEELEQ